MRLCTLTLSIIFSFSQICAAATPRPTRVLLVTDPHNASAAAWLLGQALDQTLSSRADIDTVTILPRSPKEARALTLRRDAQATLQRATRAYEMLRLDDALQDTGNAAQKLARVATLTGDVTLLPQALGLLSAIYLMLDQPASAAATHQRLLGMAPDYTPPTAIYNPDMLAVWSEARAQAAAFAMAHVSVRVTPADAVHIIDGTWLTEATTPVMPGVHVLTLARQGFESTTLQLETEAGGTLDIIVELSPRPAYPEDALVTKLAQELHDGDTAGPALEDLIRRHRLDGVMLLSEQDENMVVYYVDAQTRARSLRPILETANNQKTAARLAREVTAAYR